MTRYGRKPRGKRFFTRDFNENADYTVFALNFPQFQSLLKE